MMDPDVKGVLSYPPPVNIDTDIVNEMVRYGYNKETVLWELKMDFEFRNSMIMALKDEDKEKEKDKDKEKLVTLEKEKEKEKGKENFENPVKEIEKRHEPVSVIYHILCHKRRNGLPYSLPEPVPVQFLERKRKRESDTADQISQYYKVDYRSLLGAGSFGTVHKGVHKITQMKVAVKVIRTKEVSDYERKLVDREILACRHLVHPCLLQHFQAIREKDQVHIVMEYAEGGDLEVLLRKFGKIGEKQACSFFTQLIDAVHYCHGEGFVHRDLKPSNLLFVSKDKIKLADFGYCNWKIKHGQVFSSDAGTKLYKAPEVAGQPVYDGMAADIYSCGAILFEMLTAKIYNSGEPLDELHVSPEALDMLKGLLHKDPAKRMKITEVSKHRWLLK